MEGLVKGLVDLALGHGDNDDERDSQSRDERSRSTWSQVVSGEQDNNEDGDRNRRHDLIKIIGIQRNRRDGMAAVPDPRGNPTRRRCRRDMKMLMEVNIIFIAKAMGSRRMVKRKRLMMGGKLLAKNHLGGLTRFKWTNGMDTKNLQGKRPSRGKIWHKEAYLVRCRDDVFRRPTFSRFCSLLDNYNPHQGGKEVVTSEERQEQEAFIEEISRTAPIKYLHRYLISKAIIYESYQDFKRTLNSLWFDLYARGGASGSSSAFEHVFVGEIKQRGEQEVSGFHNWIQFYLEEAKERVDYQGYIFPRRRGQIPDSETQLLTIQFEWNGVLKSVSSTLVGVSPEFEIALYTLCFYVGGEDNHVQLGPYPVNIKCYTFGNRIGSCFSCCRMMTSSSQHRSSSYQVVSMHAGEIDASKNSRGKT
ncbi:poly(U)-specific endoribonuclease-B [Quillaja saponaria]|uniref:Poly(U)-specific endoribonuclease-B n=1 Tax=Quillaja saponaria TaxID=32244 RepID=A0AAD7L7F3_QUISA|nr:poly(U)-specific endoribonuclease-B [Quillaja saponaria]